MRYKRIDEWLNYNPMTDEDQSIYRIIIGLFGLCSIVGVFRLETLLIFPSSFFQPQPGIAMMFDNLPSVDILHTLSVISIVSLTAILFGFKTRLHSLIFGLSFLISTAIIYSFSKIGHQHLIPYTILIFAFSNWGNRYSLDSYGINKQKRKYNIYPLLALIIAFSFFTSGFSKILGGWLNPEFQATRYYIIQNHTFSERINILTNWAIHGVTNRYIWEFIDYVIVMIEVLPLLTLFYPKIFRISMFIIATFHLLVYLVMNITFGIFPILYLPFIINWRYSRLIQLVKGWFADIRFTKKNCFFMIILFTVCTLILHYLINFNGAKGLSIHRGIMLIVSYLIVLVFFIESILTYRCNNI